MRLDRILRLAREIEQAWPRADRHQKINLAQDSRYAELRREVAACGDERLASAHLHDEISLAHFFACMVPFERAAGRALRDDEFLIVEGDAATKAAERVPLKLIVENLRSAFNVGALFRTGECLGVSEILLCGYTPGPDEEKTSRTAMGTSSMVPWRLVDRARAACEELRVEGYTIVALETGANAVSLHEIKFSGPTAFVIGNERFGVEAETLQAADAICRIPVRGIKNSMNAGVAFGIGAFEWLRQYEANR